MSGPERTTDGPGAEERYPTGPDAPQAAEAEALLRLEGAQALVLVEGISDQIAVERSAWLLGHDLDAAGVVVIPIGGAQAVRRVVARFGPGGARLALTGLCDAGEEHVVRRALALGGVGEPRSREALAELGFHVCDRDLEDELIRAAGQTSIEQTLDGAGDLGSFRTLQKQPAWREGHFDAQFHRWLRAGAGRNLRYARLLLDAMAVDRLPAPLVGVVVAAMDAARRRGPEDDATIT